MTDPNRSPLPAWRQSRYGFAGFFAVSLVAACLVLRLAIYVAFRAELQAPAFDAVKALGVGLYRDGFIALVGTLPLLVWFWVVPNRWFGRLWHRALLIGGFFLFWLVEVFLLAVEFFFFDEFRSRFNTVAVDYLLYPHEVFINIWDSYPVIPIVLVCAAMSLAWLWIAHRWFSGIWQCAVRGRTRFLILLGALILAAAWASTFNPKAARVSRERALNELANNGVLSFAAAIWTRQLDFAAFYRTLPTEEAYERARRLLAEPQTEFVGDRQSTRRRVPGDPTRPRLNVVIILEESLGSEFWGSLGRPGETCTPEMDRLAAEEGMLFTNLYASGNRTIRGFEGVLASFPPLPGDSIVARDRSENVETIARILGRDGYRSVFVYGGRGIFDSMRSFTLANGYDRFVEQKDFPNPTFKTVWGVCDEDIMMRTIEECRALAKTGQPFFATVLSVSNHKPFTYPTGRIPEDPNARRREHAVKYSDYALGQFFKAARQESFWTNTVFAVVADHGSRVYGSQTIPIRSYEIPLLIAGPAVVQAPSRVGHLGCSLDVAPTILGLIGRPYETLFFGRDLLKSPPEDGRVLIHHNRDVGMYSRERLVTLELRKGIEFYAGDPRTRLELVKEPSAGDLELERDTIALYQVADDLYMSRRYRIDP